MLKVNEMLDAIYQGRAVKRQKAGGVIADFSAVPLLRNAPILTDVVMEYQLKFTFRARIQSDQSQMYVEARKDVARHISRLLYKEVRDDLIDILLEIDGLRLDGYDVSEAQKKLESLIEVLGR